MRRLFTITFLCICSFRPGLSQNQTVDSLRQVLPTVKGKDRINVLQSLVINLWLNHPDTAMQYAQEAVRLAFDLGDTRSQAIAIRIMGGVHLYQGTHDSALYYSKKAYELSIRSRDSTLISSSINNLGFTYYHLGSYSEALENLLRSLDMKIKIRQNYGLGQTLNNVGLVYSKLKDYEVARKYFKDAIEVSDTLNDNNIKLYSYNNIGFTYLYEGDLSLAESYFKDALKIAKLVNNTNWHATSFSGLAQTYYRRGLLDSARKQFKVSFKLRQHIGDKNGISEIYYYLSKLCVASRNLDSAFVHLSLSHHAAKLTKSKERLLENFELYTQLYVLRKQYDSALYFQTRYLELRDKLFNENSARNLADIQLKIQEEKAGQKLAAKDVQLQRRTLLSNFLIVIAVLTFVFALLVFWSYKRQRKLGKDLLAKNREIGSQKEEIESQKEALVLTNSELEKAHDLIKKQIFELAALNSQLQNTVDVRTKELESATLELDNFMYKSSHDIRGPLVRLLGICHVALLDVQDTKAREYFTMMSETAQHINNIFDRMKMLSDINSMEVAHELIDFESLIARAREDLKMLHGYSAVEFVIDIDKDLKFYSDKFLLETIVHNMVENSVKFHEKSEQENKFIRLTIKSKGKKSVLFSFIDNGIGIKKGNVDEIFAMFSKAASEYRNVGLGLYIVKQCVAKLDGKVRLLRSNDGFTSFEVKLPRYTKIVI